VRADGSHRTRSFRRLSELRRALRHTAAGVLPDCGQESHVRPPRIGEFLQQFGGAYLATEGALWRTLKLLLFRPAS